jgi:alanine racemase
MSGTAGLEGESQCIARNRLTAVVWNAGHLETLAEAGRVAGLETPLLVHIEVDTGMSRQGVRPGAELDALLSCLSGKPRLALGGIFTHFASTEVAGSSQTKAQQAQFEAAVAQVAGAGLRPQWVHVGNSSYIDNGTADLGSLRWLASLAAGIGARAMVRSGLALYGYVLPIEGSGRPLAAPSLLPVMTWKTRVIGVQELPVGALVGYNGTFAAESPMRVALLPVGYADGLRRELSASNTRPGGWVMLHGQRAPIVGRVSMNLTTVDVSEIPGVAEGDEVVLLGDGVTADDHARLAGTIAYEIVCGVRAGDPAGLRGHVPTINIGSEKRGTI